MNTNPSLLFLLMLLIPSFAPAQEADQFLPKEFHRNSDTLQYRILYPKNFSAEKEYPLLLFLHGAGERGADNQKQLLHGGSFIQESVLGGEHPAIVVFPQCPKDDYWAQIERGSDAEGFRFPADTEPTQALSLVMGLMDELLAEDYVRKEQVYVGGLSMGGMGTLELLGRRPDTFAGALAICGGGNPDTVEGFAGNTAVWFFHGAKDQVVPVAHSVRMHQALKEAGGNTRLSIYEEATHNSWDSAFAEPRLLDWLFSQRLE